jgi:putative ABC transport system substrate-binding protein
MTGIEIGPVLMVKRADEFDAAFATMEKVADIALKHRLPLASGLRAFSEVGGLMSFSVVEPHLWRRSAFFVHKILQGSKPADLPIEQATKFDLVINLKTARTLGLTVPPMMLTRADEVIE